MTRVRRVELLLVGLPLVRPFRTSLGVATRKECVVVRVETDAAEGWGECVADIEPDWCRYYTACYAEMVHYAQIGSDMSSDFAEFERVLAQQPADLQRRVRAATRFVGPTAAFGRLVRRVIYWRQPLLAHAVAFAL